MNKVEYSKIKYGENFDFKIDNLDFCLANFGSHDKTYIYLVLEERVQTSNKLVCIYSIKENEISVVNDVECYFIFIAKVLEKVIDDYLFGDFNLNKKLEDGLKCKGITTKKEKI